MDKKPSRIFPLLIGLISVPTLVGAGLSLWWQEDATRQQRLQELTQIATSAAALTDERVREASLVAAFCAESPALRTLFDDGVPAAIADGCARLVEQRGLLLEVAEIHAGSWRSVLGRQAAPGTNLAAPPLVDDALRSLSESRPVVSDIFVLDKTNRPAFAVVHATHVGPDRAGVVAVIGQTSSLSAVFDYVTEENSVLVLDSLNQIAAQGGAPLPVSDESLDGALALRQDAGTGSDRIALRVLSLAEDEMANTVIIPLRPAARWSVHAFRQGSAGVQTLQSFYVPGLLLAFGLVVSLLGLVALSHHQRMRDRLHRFGQANEMRSEFLTTLAHEIRSPLLRLLAALRLQRARQNHAQDGASPPDALSTAEHAGGQLLLRIDELLELARPDASGELPIRPVPASLRTVVSDVVAGFDLRAAQKGLELTLSIDQRVPEHLLFDPDRISQVITNLVSNALKYTQDGAISVAVTLKAQDDTSATVDFFVQDTGIGIAKAHLPFVFRNFWVDDFVGTAGERSIGLGLPITQKILQSMGSASIKVESEVGRGTSFQFALDLPIVPGIQAGPAADPNPLSGTRVLIVEDDEIIVEVLKAQIASLGGESCSAATAAQARSMFDESHPDLVIVDLGLPDGSGLSVIQSLKRMPGSKNVPLFAMTAGSDNNRRDSAIAAGAEAIYVKPLQIHALIAQFRTLFPRRNLVTDR